MSHDRGGMSDEVSWEEVLELMSQAEWTIGCEHPHEISAFFPIQGGSKQLKKVCYQCGYRSGAERWQGVYSEEVIRSIKVLSEEEIKGLDELKLRKIRYDSAKHQYKRQVESAEWWAKYNAHMQSPYWAAIRQKVFKRDGYVCQGCFEAKAEQCHHRTYKRLGHEMVYDLISLCIPCHERAHEAPPIPQA